MSPVWQAKPLTYRDWGQGATITIKVLGSDQIRMPMKEKNYNVE